MKNLIKIMALAILLLPNYTFAHERYDRHENYRHKNYDYNYDSNRHSRAQQGWDINPRRARRASNCYYYSLYVSGGRGSARIMSLPGKNYIQINDGQKSGYVCFNGAPTLELGKLSNPDIYVELEIEDIGIFYFDRGDSGSRLINNWYRSYQNL